MSVITSMYTIAFIFIGSIVLDIVIRLAYLLFTIYKDKDDDMRYWFY
ncbi:hypothetical protein [Vallitalea guaymasensis]|nr:hypothetical protein [Vallitalea guaymasensis]